MTKKKTSKEDALKWAQKAYDKLKEKHEPKFRSKLEKNIADLLEAAGGFLLV